MVVSFTPLQPTLGIAHGDLRLVYSCSAMETCFMKLPVSSYCAAVASRGSFELSSATEDSLFFFTRYMPFNTATLAGQKFDKLTCWKGGIL